MSSGFPKKINSSAVFRSVLKKVFCSFNLDLFFGLFENKPITMTQNFIFFFIFISFIIGSTDKPILSFVAMTISEFFKIL